MRVCLDTNVLVAALATRGLCSDVLRTVLAEHELVLGEVILTELRRALEEKLRLPADRIAAAEEAFRAIEIVPEPAEPSTLQLRDPADRWIVATAVTGAAEVLVTGDSDLLEVADDAPLPMLSPRAFWDLLRSRPA
ncbi:MAG TPA: putative toxin-antitoxin system toxin component, PIN family [Thermoanaerobaculia bacterium]|nr:putative toxin-antitoxin system toxin component, PIN family [Thermoanaerobaculia bacterium]